MVVEPSYLRCLKETLSKRQSANAHYSLRAFARDLEIHPSTLCSVFQGKRPLPIKDSERVVRKLSLGPKERTLFIESLLQTKTKLDAIVVENSDDRFMLDESNFKALSEWEHYAVLTLFETVGFDPAPASIAQRLGITELRANVVLSNLIESGLLIKTQEGLRKSHSSYRTTEDVASLALQKSHLETLEMGKKKLLEVPVELRDFSSMNLVVDLEKVSEAKTIIREFRQKMAALLRDGNRTEVFQMAIQFYPLTAVNTGKE